MHLEETHWDCVEDKDCTEVYYDLVDVDGTESKTNETTVVMDDASQAFEEMRGVLVDAISEEIKNRSSQRWNLLLITTNGI